MQAAARNPDTAPYTMPKLNLVYLGRILSSNQAVHELLDLIERYVLEHAESHPDLGVILTYLREVLPNRIVLLSQKAEPVILFNSHFEYERWRTHRFTALSELVGSAPRRYQARLSDVLQRNLENFAGDSAAELQGIFDKTPTRKLLRDVS